MPLTDSISNEKTIAVLPLKNWSGNPDLEYISDGMTDAIINKLGKIQAIKKVIPYTSVAKYKNSEMSIKQIANELEVANVLQGSFQLAGNKVNIKLQMINGKEEQQFWTKEYQEIWKSDELFKLQTTVAENVSKSINVEIKENELNDLNNFPTVSKRRLQSFFTRKLRMVKGNKTWI